MTIKTRPSRCNINILGMVLQSGVAVVQWSKVSQVGTNICLELVWVPCSLAIETTMTSRCGHKRLLYRTH
jgi:hypothetical protein